MNKKIIITLVTIFIFLLVGGYVFLFINQKTPQQTTESTQQTGSFYPNDVSGTNTTTNTNASSSTPQTQTTPRLLLHTNSGDVTINDFYKSQQTRLLDEKKDAVLREGPNYYIDYIAAGQSFGVSLTGSNLQTSRSAGEQDLLKILGVTKDQACKLNVSVTVPGSVSENAAGIDYHLSFCPNAISLP